MPLTLEDWKDRYYEQQANHTEAMGMLGSERDHWKARAEKAEAALKAQSLSGRRYWRCRTQGRDRSRKGSVA